MNVIEFQCPNGHPIRVPADVAGKLGACPTCAAKVRVPQANSSPLPETQPAQDSAPVAQPNVAQPNVNQPPINQSATNPAAVQQPAPTTQAQQPVTPPAPTKPVARPVAKPVAQTAADEFQWYMQLDDGQQFGPATPAIFAQWISEGRIAPHSMVWRTGWTAWQTAGAAMTQLPAPLPAPVTGGPPLPSAVPPPTAGDASQAVAEFAAPEPEVATAANRRLRHRQQAKRMKKLVAIFLLLLILGLGGILAAVLIHQQSDEQQSRLESPGGSPSIGC